MAVNIASHAGAAQQIHVVRANQQSDVVDLRYAWCEELQRSRDPILVIALSKRIVKSAIDLIQVEVVRSGAGSLMAFVVTALVDRFHEPVDFFGREQSWNVAAFSISTHIQHTDTVMRVQHGHGIARPDRKPSLQMTRVPRIQRV